jgi:hypothetical protein
MGLSTLLDFLTTRYERLFSQRVDLEKECGSELPSGTHAPRRNRFRLAGAIFPTDPLLPRYQY